MEENNNKKWKKAGKYSNCIILGDLNLDYCKWDNPEDSQVNMIELVQQEIEPMGFVQLVSRTTRTWKDKNDSLLDHIWVNNPSKVVGHQNIVRASSDHNVIMATISGKDIKTSGHLVRKRVFKKFNKERFDKKFKDTDWTDILSETRVDIANSLLEEKILTILKGEAPMRNIQTRTKYCKWLQTTSKDKMTERNNLRETARRTQLDSDWESFKRCRNECTKLQRQDKDTHMKKSYEKI